MLALDLQLPFGHRSVEVLRCVGGTGAVKNSLSILAFLPLLPLDRFISLPVIPITGFAVFGFPFLPSKPYSGLLILPALCCFSGPLFLPRLQCRGHLVCSRGAVCAVIPRLLFPVSGLFSRASRAHPLQGLSPRHY